MSFGRKPSRFSIGDRVVLGKDWPLVAAAGEISGKVVDYWNDGRALVKAGDTGSKFVAPNDSFWNLAEDLG